MKIHEQTTNLPQEMIPQQDHPGDVNENGGGELYNNRERWKTVRNEGWLKGRHHIIWWWQWFITPCGWWDYIKIPFYKSIEGSILVQRQRTRRQLQIPPDNLQAGEKFRQITYQIDECDDKIDKILIMLTKFWLWSWWY